MFDLPETAILYASSSHGQYIPQYFAESVKRECVTGINVDCLDQLAMGPDDCPWYWEIWDKVESRATVTDPDTGVAYYLYQDGDLWLVPSDWTPED